MALHENQFFEQRHVLLVFQQRADQRRYRHFIVFALQGFQRNIFGDQQFEPIQQLAGGRLFLQPWQVAHVVKRLHRRGQQLFFEAREMHVDDQLHRLSIGELDVVEEAAAQKRIRQFFFVVGRDEHQRSVLGTHQLARLVAVKLHAVNFAQQIVGELDVGLVDLVNQQGHRRIGGKGLPQHAFDNVVVNVFDLLVTQLRVAQAAHRVILVQALLCFCGGFDVPLQQRHFQRLSHLLSQHGFAGAGLAFHQQRAFEGDRRVHRQHQVLRGDVVFSTLEFHGGSEVRTMRRTVEGRTIESVVGRYNPRLDLVFPIG